jgi:hypothetical protein
MTILCEIMEEKGKVCFLLLYLSCVLLCIYVIIFLFLVPATIILFFSLQHIMFVSNTFRNGNRQIIFDGFTIKNNKNVISSFTMPVCQSFCMLQLVKHRHTSGLVKITQQWWTLYIKTYILFCLSQRH